MMNQSDTEDRSKGWDARMRAEEPAAAEQWGEVDAYRPHDGENSDVNLHYADLLAGPNLNVPDVMADWRPEQSEDTR